jgi:hypothetical protein
MIFRYLYFLLSEMAYFQTCDVPLSCEAQGHRSSPCQADPRPLSTTQGDTPLPHNGPVTMG